jgi:hypothetical protein
MLVIDESNRNAVVPALRRAAEHAEYRSSPYHRTAGSAMGGGTPLAACEQVPADLG